MPEVATDRALLEEIVRDERIVTTPSTRWDELWAAFWRWLDDLFGARRAPDLSGVAEIAAWVGLALVVAAGVYALWRAYEAWARSRRPPEPAAVAVVALEAPPDPTSALEAALAAGDARGALAALWAELALGLGQGGVARATGQDRTHQELVRLVRAARPGWDRLGELRDLARILDRLCYGAVAPTVDDVRPLVPRARGLVA